MNGSRLTSTNQPFQKLASCSISTRKRHGIDGDPASGARNSGGILHQRCANAADPHGTDGRDRRGGTSWRPARSVKSKRVAAAKTAAVTTAAMNNVYGEPLQLQSADGANEIEFGTTEQPDGV